MTSYSIHNSHGNRIKVWTEDDQIYIYTGWEMDLPIDDDTAAMLAKALFESVGDKRKRND